MGGRRGNPASYPILALLPKAFRCRGSAVESLGFGSLFEHPECKRGVFRSAARKLSPELSRSLVNSTRGLTGPFAFSVYSNKFKLHHDPRNEVTVTSHSLGGDPIESGSGRVEGYSSRERKELQADVFAGEFLCPSDWLRQEFIDHGRRPAGIADALGLPVGLVMNQVIRALLLPPIRPAMQDVGAQSMKLDDSQQIAATWSDGPLLVNAGPGTGKTRTLVHRIRHLLEQGAAPASILALTFSRKAAEEMRERLSVMNADAAIEMWVGTFHAFGMEMLTKWPARLGRTGKVRILDQTGALAILEENLDKLPLRHFQNLYEPAYELVHVLKAISRCKDELITPAVYREAAAASERSARTPEEREKAEKMLEVAGIYEVYEQLLVDRRFKQGHLRGLM